jgi:hypothetical protein
MKPKSYAWLGGTIGGWIFFVFVSIGFCLMIFSVFGAIPLKGFLCSGVEFDCIGAVTLFLILPIYPLIMLFPGLYEYPFLAFGIGLVIYMLIGAGLGFLYGKIKNKNKNTKV